MDQFYRDNLCREGSDPFLEDKVIWKAHLCNGEVIYQDDDRTDIHSAWIRLSNYIKETGLTIKAIELKFRSNGLVVPIGPFGCMFSKAIGKDWDGDVPDYFYVVGDFASPNNVFCRWFRVPELIEFKSELRELEDCKPEQLIPFTVENRTQAC